MEKKAARGTGRSEGGAAVTLGEQMGSPLGLLGRSVLTIRSSAAQIPRSQSEAGGAL